MPHVHLPNHRYDAGLTSFALQGNIAYPHERGLKFRPHSLFAVNQPGYHRNLTDLYFLLYLIALA